MHTRIPSQIRNLLTDYLTLLDSSLPEFVSGLYIHGSIALDAFQENLSDIDCTAFLSRHATAHDLETLSALHHTIATQHPRWLLEVSYLQWGDLGSTEDIITSPIHHDNKLEANGNFDVNSVTWWVLQHHGIALIGPEPSQLPLTVEWDTLIAHMHTNLNSYWATYIHKPRRIAWLISDFGIEWTVLGVLRQYYSFVAHGITSKVGAGEYALTHLPTRWNPVIREAIRLRRRESTPLYANHITRAADAYNFLRFIIDECNRILAEK